MRSQSVGNKPIFDNKLIIIIEGGDFMIPEGEISRLGSAILDRIQRFGVPPPLLKRG